MSRFDCILIGIAAGLLLALKWNPFASPVGGPPQGV